MSNTRFFNPRRNGAWSGIGIDRAAARSNAMHFPDGKSFGGMVITGGSGLVRFIRSDAITAMIRQLPLQGYSSDGT
jgi:hypothetical protein